MILRAILISIFCLNTTAWSQNINNEFDEEIIVLEVEQNQSDENGANTDDVDQCEDCRAYGHYVSGSLQWGTHLGKEELLGGPNLSYEFRARRGGGLDVSFGHMGGKGVFTGKVTGWIPLKKIIPGNIKFQAIVGGTAIDQNLSNTVYGSVGAGIGWVDPFAEKSLRIILQPTAYIDDRGLFLRCNNAKNNETRGFQSGINVAGDIAGGRLTENGVCSIYFQGHLDGGIVYGLKTRFGQNEEATVLNQVGVGGYFGAGFDAKALLGKNELPTYS